MSKNISAPVKIVGRAGRAPYNFVPLPDQSLQGEDWMAPPDQSAYQPGKLSGEIVCRITAREPFYIRGMWTWEEALAGKGKEQNAEPFRAAGRLRLPGTSIRGMVRNLVEILSKTPLQADETVNDHQLFFRAVGASNNPRFGNSYEPHAEVYKGLLGNMGERVKAGYLFIDREGNWKIQPALKVGGLTHVKTRLPKMDYWRRRPVRFDVEEGKVPRAHISQNGKHDGWLICSGAIPKKVNQWVMFGPDKAAKAITVPPADVEAYRESGGSQLIEALYYRMGRDKLPKEDFTYGGKDQRPTPCFYVEWDDDSKQRHVSFGHTPFFRLPYRRTTAQAIPAANQKKQDKWNLADALFGRVTAACSVAGRVFFEDGCLDKAPASPEAAIPGKVVLGSPKPTTYQHYLVQPSNEVTESKHWDSEGAKIRGHKLYWHRPNAWKLIRRADLEQDNVATGWKPAAAGHEFRARIRYENLHPFELGALLYALDLPQGCLHHLGMGKALGLGSFHFEIAVSPIDREERYRRLFKEGEPTALETGAGSEDLELARSDFRTRFYKGSPGERDLWEDTVLKELKALLQYESMPPNWANRTRNLEFGRLNGRPVNEYLVDSQGQLSKRRPLPPATQVLTAAPGQLPDDPRPNFEKGD